jgi:CDP-diacylglycerol---glycerol-3-phosphate 3-phosphatidyltransferase
MNLPNILTLLRIFFVPLLVAALVQEGLWLPWPFQDRNLLALSIFLFAACTDILDGYLARRWQQVTTVGTLLDPIADKLLISAALISLVQVRRMPGWMAILIVGREFAVSGLRSIAAAEGYTIKASELGKTKTFMQVVAISLVMLSISFPGFKTWSEWAMWGVVVFSVVSAVDYFNKFWRKVDDGVKLRRRQELLVLERQKRRTALLAAREERARARAAAAAATSSSQTSSKF